MTKKLNKITDPQESSIIMIMLESQERRLSFMWKQTNISGLRELPLISCVRLQVSEHQGAEDESSQTRQINIAQKMPALCVNISGNWGNEERIMWSSTKSCRCQLRKALPWPFRLEQ